MYKNEVGYEGPRRKRRARSPVPQVFEVGADAYGGGDDDDAAAMYDWQLDETRKLSEGEAAAMAAGYGSKAVTQDERNRKLSAARAAAAASKLTAPLQAAFRKASARAQSTSRKVRFGAVLLFVGALMLALAIPSPMTREQAGIVGVVGFLVCCVGALLCFLS